MNDESDRGAAIIRRALELLRLDQAKSWSHALDLARREVTAQSGA